MKAFRVVFIAVAFAVSASCWAQGQPGDREQLIRAHNARIQEVLKASRIVHQANASPGAAYMLLPAAPNSESQFESSLSPLLQQAGVPADKIDVLRRVNKDLWSLVVSDKEATAPEVIQRAKELLAEQTAVITPGQKATVDELWKQRTDKLMRSQSGQTTAPPPRRMEIQVPTPI